MAFYNVSDPHDTWAQHSTAMVKQELAFWLSVFTPTTVDDDVDTLLSRIVAATHYTATYVSKACDVALMLHDMPQLREFALNTGTLCLRRLHTIYTHTLMLKKDLLPEAESRILTMVAPTSDHQQLPSARVLAAKTKKIVLALDPPAVRTTLEVAEEDFRFRSHPNGITTMFGALRSEKAVVIKQVLSQIAAAHRCGLNDALYLLATSRVEGCKVTFNVWNSPGDPAPSFMEGVGWVDMRAAATKTSNSYHTPSDIRAFVIGRDGTCRFPGCDQPAWECEMDHIISDADGGPTTASNLQALCKHCHNIKTDKTVVPRMLDSGHIEWTFNDGHTTVTEPTGPLADIEMQPPPFTPPTPTTPRFRQTFAQRKAARISRASRQSRRPKKP